MNSNYIFKVILIVGLSLLFYHSSFSQNKINYLELRKDKVVTSCTMLDTESINTTLDRLLEIDSLKITEGLWQYYYDLGSNYYFKALVSSKINGLALQ